MNYKEVMDYVNNMARFGTNLGLSRTEKLLELLGNPHKKLKCIHIAGTNGKGSTTAMINEILKEAGYKVGMYTSPYIEEFEERIQVNGKNINKDELVDLIARVKMQVDKVIQMGFEHPTQFEIITCAMYLYFYEKKVDYAVIEVGMGGRLDSTNVITPILTIITSISFDHMGILGDTLDKIAAEKAGIIKKNVPLILYPQEPIAEKVIENVCVEKGSKIIKVDKNSAKHLENIQVTKKDGVKAIMQRLKIKTEKDTYILDLNLLGKHQITNCIVTIKAVEELINLGVKISKENVENALKNVVWPARFEIVKNKPMVVLDGAHNIDGIVNITESLKEYIQYDNLILILGILADKQVDSMIRVITPKAKKVLTVTPNSNRAELSEDLRDEVLRYNKNCRAFLDYETAYNEALTYCGDNDLLLICGSLYMVGDMRRIIRRK